MIASAYYPLPHALVEQLRDRGQVPLEFTCLQAARVANTTIEEVYRTLAELMHLDIVNFDPVVTVQGQTEPQAAIKMDHVGYDLYCCLTEVSTPTRTLSCGATMLFIVNSCGMATKSQLFARLNFVKGARRYSYMHKSVQLWALVRSGRLVVRRDDLGTPLFDITGEGLKKVSHHQKQLGYSGTINISMGE